MVFRTHQGNDSRPQSNDTRHRGDDSPSDGRKQSRRIDPSEQQFRGRKRRHGAPLQRFLPWLAENATMGPLEASRSRRKSLKRGGEARKATESPQWGPECHTGPCSEAPYRRFLPSCEQNRATAASRKEKPVKRYEHLTGIRPDALSPLSTRCFCPKGIANTVSRRLRIHPRTPLKTPLRRGITAFSLNRKALAGPPLSPGQWAHGETRWWPFKGIGQCTLPGLQSIRRGRNVPTRS